MTYTTLDGEQVELPDGLTYDQAVADPAMHDNLSLGQVTALLELSLRDPATGLVIMRDEPANP